MSWLYSRALVAEYLEANCSDGERFALLKLTPTPHAYLPKDRMTAFCRPSRFGMTFDPLMDDLGADLLTWFLVASRARIFQSQAKELDSTASDLAFGVKWRELSVKYSRDSSSWKTHQCLLDEDFPESSLTLPKWGLMRNGVLWERLTLEHRTAANDAGLWPTPTVCGNHNRKGASATSGDGLATAVKKRPTPTVNDSKNSTLPPSQLQHDNIPGALLRDGEMAGGELNPTWVEWLMGWPLGWTDLKPLAMGRSHNAQQKLGEF